MRTEGTICRFAEEHKLRLRRDECGDGVIMGRNGHVYLYDHNRLGVMFMPDPPRPHLWAHARHKLLAAGFEVVQDGDWEGAATFNPNDINQVKAALAMLRLKPTRPRSTAQLRHLETLRTYRFVRGTARTRGV